LNDELSPIFVFSLLISDPILKTLLKFEQELLKKALISIRRKEKKRIK